jgi:hypothetical protein
MTQDPAALPASDEQALPQAGIFELPRDTTPTWEVELLLSGALVFSMLQVPGLLDDLNYALRPRLKGDLSGGVLMLYFYLKVSSYALIATFVLHLAVRAIWVAALGLRSVYPEGVLWENLRRGPVFIDYSKRNTLTLDQMIDRTDNRASLVFAFGMLLVLMSLAITLFTTALACLGGLISHFLLGGSRNPWITTVLVMVIAAPLLLAYWLDRRLGARIPQHHWLAGCMRFMFRVGSLMIWGRFTHPILLTVSSRIGVGRGNLLMAGALYTLMAVVALQIVVQTGAISLPGEQYLPQERSARELDAVNYADVRDLREAQQGQAFIQSEIIRGPYLRLFIPYVPKRLDAALELACPDAIPTQGVAAATDDERLAAEQVRTEALLDCAADTLYPLRLDGKPQKDLRYDIARDPLTSMRGFVAMIDVRDLAPGRHELELTRPQQPDSDDPVRPARIPFWR